ncbi:hypothetical protein BaRGS_00016622 [Batillaria attramentaria]|uniref:Uncharacterized protein n=1 Tax=Batillaria attramentaria TaxID=370345 RepID=A0ABD0KYA7_9CAEN
MAAVYVWLTFMVVVFVSLTIGADGQSTDTPFMWWEQPYENTESVVTVSCNASGRSHAELIALSLCTAYAEDCPTCATRRKQEGRWETGFAKDAFIKCVKTGQDITIHLQTTLAPGERKFFTCNATFHDDVRFKGFFYTSNTLNVRRNAVSFNPRDYGSAVSFNPRDYGSAVSFNPRDYGSAVSFNPRDTYYNMFGNTLDGIILGCRDKRREPNQVNGNPPRIRDGNGVIKREEEPVEPPCAPESTLDLVRMGKIEVQGSEEIQQLGAIPTESNYDEDHLSLMNPSGPPSLELS